MTGSSTQTPSLTQAKALPTPPAPEKAASPPANPTAEIKWNFVIMDAHSGMRFTCDPPADNPTNCQIENGTLGDVMRVILVNQRQNDSTEADLRARLKIATDALREAEVAMQAAHEALEADRRAFDEIHRTLSPDPKKK